MIKKRIKLIVITGILLIIVLSIMFFFQPLFSKKSYIGKILQLNIPESAKLIDYKFGINTYGIDPFYSKLQLNQDTYNEWRGKHFFNGKEYQLLIEYVKNKFSYETLNLEKVEEIFLYEKMTSKYSFFIAGSTRVVYGIITKDTSSKYYLYVLY